MDVAVFRRFFMQMHVGHAALEEKGRAADYFAGALARLRGTGAFPENAGLHAANPLLYRCFPLTCARSQE
jgi:hypothetical protein